MRWALQNSLHFSKREGKGLKQLKEELESPPPLSLLLSSGSYANTGAPPWALEHKLGLNPKGGNCLGLQSASTSRTLNQSVSIKPNSTKLRGESFSNTIIYFFQTKEQWMKYTINEMSPSSLPKGISVLFRCLPLPQAAHIPPGKGLTVLHNLLPSSVTGSTVGIYHQNSLWDPEGRLLDAVRCIQRKVFRFSRPCCSPLWSFLSGLISAPQFGQNL